MTPDVEMCGAWGGCPLPKAHNMGRADIPENHWRTTDAPDRWDDSVAPGGYVCSACGMPTESEPCAIHQSNAREATR